MLENMFQAPIRKIKPNVRDWIKFTNKPNSKFYNLLTNIFTFLFSFFCISWTSYQ